MLKYKLVVDVGVVSCRTFMSLPKNTSKAGFEEYFFDYSVLDKERLKKIFLTY
jgi:hypothetical protein